MPRFQRDQPAAPATLTPAEREWIRRQGMSARALEREQREIRERLATAARRKLTEKRRMQV